MSCAAALGPDTRDESTCAKGPEGAARTSPLSVSFIFHVSPTFSTFSFSHFFPCCFVSFLSWYPLFCGQGNQKDHQLAFGGPPKTLPSIQPSTRGFSLGSKWNSLQTIVHIRSLSPGRCAMSSLDASSKPGGLSKEMVHPNVLPGQFRRHGLASNVLECIPLISPVLRIHQIPAGAMFLKRIPRERHSPRRGLRSLCEEVLKVKARAWHEVLEPLESFT